MPSPQLLSIADQLQVLHSEADVASVALEQLGLPAAWRDTNEEGHAEHCQAAVDRVFTLTRADIEADLAMRGLQPEQLPFVRTTTDAHDGWYLMPREGDWDYYWQERGYPNFLWTFDDFAEVRKMLLNQFIPIWLERLHVPFRMKDGKTATHL